MLPLIRKHTPKSGKDIIAQDEAITQLRSFILNYKKQKKKAVLLYGPTGTGKTSSAHALAKELDLEIFEINASDFRNKNQINEKLGSAINQYSLFSKGKLILVDDIDGLSGTKDRGAVTEIIKLMQKSTFPIILTAINPYDQKFSSLRNKTILVQFKPLGVNDTASFLEKICKDEKLTFTLDILKSIARRSGGDLRAAINDLEILSTVKDEITKESLEELGIREKEDTIINALLKIFKSTDPKIAINAFDYVNENLDQQMLWLDENLPKEYEKPADLQRAYDKLSRADIFSRRIRRWQHWRFLVYINALITAGIAVSKDKKYNKFVQYKPTGRILKLWWAKQKSMKKKAIAEKIAHHTHTSKREAIKSMPYFQIMFKKDKQLASKLAQEFDLDKDELTWLKK
ncbi:MAG: replication factor C large subunit [Nanoarchaeota archaeon]|nr:replication factor C large subunit [Nanoarchaeota archaeon]